MDDRMLDWDGCYNVRDLGGLPAAGGARTRHRAVVRADSPSALNGAGWDALWEYGIRTVVDLTEEHERLPDTAPRPPGLTTVHVPLDGTDDAFWAPFRDNGHWGTALYYSAFLARYPDRTAAAVAAVANAAPGGVLVHCGRGRDRTGLISLLLLSLVGVEPAVVSDDYRHSDSAMVVTRRQRLGLDDDTVRVAEIYAEAGTTPHDTIGAVLARLDAEEHLRAGGLTVAEVAAVRSRLLEPVSPRSS